MKNNQKDEGHCDKDQRKVAKPAWMNAMEKRIGEQVTLHPNTISSIKLFLITPALYFSFKQVDVLPNSSAWIFFLFICFCMLDYLDGVVARVHKRETSFGLIYDRFTDYPLLFLVAWQCVHIIPLSLLVAKLALDCILLIQFLLKTGITENRVRTTISYTTLVSLLFLSQGWGSTIFNTEVVNALLFVNIAFNATVALYNARILQLRFVADSLSAANLLCGLMSMYFAYYGRFEISLLFLILGCLFDGFDGAAARKWGGTRWGVYSDDIADGVNYGIAPGVALFFMIQGFQGVVTGFLYSFFTISRLVYFTLNKEESDPNFFCGAPSTIGGLMVICALILFQQEPVLLGLLVGMACVQMISFDVHYRHLGRAFSESRKRYKLGGPLYALCLILGAFIWGTHISVAILLLLVLGYGFAPSYLHMKHVLQITTRKRSEESLD